MRHDYHDHDEYNNYNYDNKHHDHNIHHNDIHHDHIGRLCRCTRVVRWYYILRSDNVERLSIGSCVSRSFRYDRESHFVDHRRPWLLRQRCRWLEIQLRLCEHSSSWDNRFETGPVCAVHCNNNYGRGDDKHLFVDCNNNHTNHHYHHHF